ncbi:MAG: choice-of-anchor J domain-containing protein, partial [Candidatus Zophobacter franzmannii]|nr:choice-of-anchor J domain-containing protein [Candidatus Zophobacter franzmannii]
VSLGTDNPPTDVLDMMDVGTVTTYDVAGLTPDTMYYWQVVPYNAEGMALNCPIWSFTTFNSPPNVATIVAPIDTATEVSVTPMFAWMSGGNYPEGYKVSLGADNPPTDVMDMMDVGMVSSYLVDTTLAFDTMYYWQITPYNIIGDTPNAPVWSFTTRPDGVVTIGTGTEINTHLPVETGLAYSYSQSIYYPEDLGTPGLISTLSYYYNGSATLDNNSDWTVYMGLTTDDSFADSYSWIPANQLTQVFDGMIPQPAGEGWITIDLDDDFLYNGTSNLVIVIDENQTGSGTPTEEFYCTDTGINRSIYNYSGVTNIDPATPPTATGTSTMIPNIMLDMLTLGDWPYVVIDTTPLEYGMLDVNTVSTPMVIEIGNLGFVDAIIDPAIAISGVDADQFVITDLNTYPLNIPQLGIATIEVTFNPTSEGHKEAIITIVDNYNPTRETHEIAVHGYAFVADGNDTSDMAFEIVTDIVEIPAILHDGMDQDWYVFWQTGPAHIEIHTENLYGSLTDTYASFYGPYTNLGLVVDETMPLAEDDNSFDALNPEIAIDVTDSGYYYLLIENAPTTRVERWDTDDYMLYVDRPFTLPPAALPPTDLVADVTFQGINLAWLAPVPATRDLMGYNVYRDDVMINADAVMNTIFRDPIAGLVFDQTYQYKITALYDVPASESDPTATLDVTFTFEAPPLIAEDFESYADFATEFGYWESVDVDGANTMTFDNGVDFAGEGTPMAFMVFNPSATTPPLQDADAYSGDKYAACFAATTGMNDDWLITPQIQLSDNAVNMSFFARSYATDMGMEQFEIAVSDIASADPMDFTVISGDNPLEASLAWTEYMQDLSAYSGQLIRVAIHSVSDQTFFLMVDDLMIENENGTLEADDQPFVPELTALNGNYPNPFNPETAISFNLKDNSDVTIDIYNIKGQRIARVANDVYAAGTHKVIWKGKDLRGNSVASGVYFYKMQSGTYTKTKKMILMK